MPLPYPLPIPGFRIPHFAKHGPAHLTTHQPEQRAPQGVRPRRDRIDRLLTSYQAPRFRFPQMVCQGPNRDATATPRRPLS
jgi:hypothetical protein